MKKILIIEDDQLVANIYRNKFIVEGFQVEIAEDGESGLNSLRSLRPDAVILDLMLPRLSGVDLMKQVRAEPQFEKLPIIVFSNTYLSNMVQDAWKAGATKCLSKASCSPQQLISIVKSVINGESPNSNGLVAATAEPQTNGKPPTPAGGVADASRDPRKAFLDTAPTTVSALRMLLQATIKETGADQVKHIEAMYRHAHALTSKAALATLFQTAHISDALEALLKELHDKPSNINASTLRTAASAVDFLGSLIGRDESSEKADPLTASILVVDDEPISRRAVTHALERAKLKAVAVDNPQFAYDLICENKFELIFLDVDMPGMNGYELCTKLRTLPAYKTTPVVFVTGMSDFESRANSMMSGGNDFIAKPFLFMELAVKALVYVMRHRLQAA
jgi:DNA-binding response OmpR family regulator